MNRRNPPARLVRAAQRGVVLLMALIVLVALMVAGIGMMRSVDTATLIAGNLAFQQSATYASDKGVEAAMTMLQTRRTANLLGTNGPDTGYLATYGGMTPAAGTSWQKFWDDNFSATAVDIGPGPDQFGNTVYYVVQRQCRDTGPSSGASCLSSPPKASGGGATSGGDGPIASSCAGGDCDSSNTNKILGNSQVYYRITVRVSGPRRTESYVQTNIAM